MRTIAVRLTALIFGLAKVSGNAQSLSPEQWQQDLDQLTTAVREIHFKPFHTLPEDEFQSAIDSLHARIPQLTDPTIEEELVRLEANL